MDLMLTCVSRAKGLDFVIFRDRRNIGHEEFELLGPGDELRIIPVIRGSKRAGLFQAFSGRNCWW
jgi:predicted phage tail protein